MSGLIIAASEATNRAIAGGKAAMLARLASLAPVPPFLVISNAAFSKDGLYQQAKGELEEALTRLGSGPFAVRSSGIAEDGTDHAHAGQFLTELNVTVADVAAAAFRVLQSGAASNVAAYRAAHGIEGASGMAVIVQAQLHPSVAGIAFSADPVSGRRDQVVIAAVAGLADKLAAGDSDGDTYHVDRNGNMLSADCQAGPVLDPAEIGQITALTLACETQIGQPQDIEWAIENDVLYLLQSRPITTLSAQSAGDQTLTIWDNSNIVESYPGVVSPLTFSFARYVYANVYRVLLRLVGVRASVLSRHKPVLDALLGRIDGHVYYHLLNWYCTLGLLPGFALNRGFMEQMMGVGEALPKEIADTLVPPSPRGWKRIAAWLQLIQVFVMLIWRACTLPGMIRKFMRRLAHALDNSKDFYSMPLTMLAAEYRSLEAALLERWDAPLVNDLICMIAFGLSRRCLERWTGREGAALHNDVMIGQGDIISAEPAQRIRAMAALIEADEGALEALRRGNRAALPAGLEREITAYLNWFGDRCPGELKLESIPLTTDPQPLLNAIAATATSVNNRVTGPRPDVEVKLNRLLTGKPLRRLIARALLGWAKARVRDRENLRFERTRLFGQVRRIMLAIGRKLAAGGVIDTERDIFQLTIDEVLGAIEGGAVTYDLRELIALRRQEFVAVPVPERIEMRGAVVLAQRVKPVAKNTADTALTRKGTGCSPGLIQGTARVITDPRMQSIGSGEILVARHTDPGWIALFANVAGIVVERGSLLSHSAIVAREMGVPCVVGLKDALNWIEDGETIEVNGATGQVTRCR